MKDRGAPAFWGFVLGVVATLLVFWLVIAGLRAAVVLVIPTASSLSTRAAGQGLLYRDQSPGDRAQRGSHYLSIGSLVHKARSSLCASTNGDAAMVPAPAKQYGGFLTPTLPVDSNFLSSSSREGRTHDLSHAALGCESASLPAEANRGTLFLHKHEIPRPVVDRHTAPGRAVSPGVEHGA